MDKELEITALVAGSVAAGLAQTAHFKHPDGVVNHGELCDVSIDLARRIVRGLKPRTIDDVIKESMGGGWGSGVTKGDPRVAAGGGVGGLKDFTAQARGSGEVPRRNQLDKSTPAELAIRAAADLVEAMPADVRLTDAVNLLREARESVADYIDGVEKRRQVVVTETV